MEPRAAGSKTFLSPVSARKLRLSACWPCSAPPCPLETASDFPRALKRVQELLSCLRPASRVRGDELHSEHHLKENERHPLLPAAAAPLSLSLCPRRTDDLGLCPGWGCPGQAGVREPGSAGGRLSAQAPLRPGQREAAAELLPGRGQRGGAEVSGGAERVTRPTGLRSNPLHSSSAELVGASPCCCWTRTQPGLSRAVTGHSHC